MSGLNKSSKYNIGVITAPLGDVKAEISATSLIQILEPLCDEGFLITGNFSYSVNTKIHVIEVETGRNYNKTVPLWIRIPRFILIQLKISYNLVKISKNIDIVLFNFGSRFYVLPVLCSKLLRKRTVVFSFGSTVKLIEKTEKTLFGIGGFVFSRIMWFLERISFSLCDLIVVESEGIINFAGLSKYRNKISNNYTSPEYVDTDIFRIKKDRKDRRNLVGYVGRLSEEKGVMNFTKAIPLILKEKDDLEFLIGGNGPLFDKIKNDLKTNGSYDNVEFTGWIPHDTIPDYLNELKLLILPSFTEGLPAMLREAMSCGTPVLATSVGSIPDLIKDGETGFILENNSPECIAENVIRALEHQNLDEIVRNARKVIEDEYTYEATVKRYWRILKELP